jgi:GNAT superfamily N-acetyltransferase
MATPEIADGLISMVLSLPNIQSFIAERDGKIVGSNFLWDGMPVAGIGPISVAPSAQNGSVGRILMEAALKHAQEQRFPSVRLVQAAYHNRSLSLYAKLGFEVREPLANIQGTPPKVEIAGCIVRRATRGDLTACNQLCFRVHGHDRRWELEGAIDRDVASVVERGGRITGYTPSIGFFGHAVGESNDDLKALIAAADEFSGPGFLLPTRNADLFRWCLENGLRVVQPLTLMSFGLYNEPRGAFLPSILY